MKAWTLLLATVGCLDLGYSVPPGDAGSLDGAVEPYGDGGCVEGPVDPETAGVEVRIGALSVDQPLLAVPAGGVVVWLNTDVMVHRMVAGAPGAEVPLSSGGFESPNLAGNRRYAHRFCRPRSLVYHCSTHPALMSGYRLTIE